MTNNNLGLLMPAPPPDRDRAAWATVTAVSPLSIRLDSDGPAGSPLPFEPDTLVWPLIVGDRVWCALVTNPDPKFQGRRVTILGVVGGAAPQTHTHAQYADKPLFAYKTADGTPKNNNSTLSNDPDLFVTLEANTVYTHNLNLTYQSNPTPALQIDFTLPASATMAGNIFACGGTGSNFQHGSMGLTLVGALGISGNTGLRVSGLIITAGTAGLARVRWAQAVANASDTFVRAGSSWEVRKVSP